LTNISSSARKFSSEGSQGIAIGRRLAGTPIGVDDRNF
jgi:hypothetical protein